MVAQAGDELSPQYNPVYGKENRGSTYMRISKPFILEVALVVSIATVCFAAGIEMQGDFWTVLYFSGAEHILSQGQWLLNKNDYSAFLSLNDLEKIWFDFSVTQNVANQIPANYYGSAFLHAIIMAKLTLPFIPPIIALVVLQVIIHCIICIAVLRRFSEIHLKLAFIALYALNPVVLKFVCFAYYYFWQVLPSFFLVLYLLDKKSWGAYLLPVSVILAFSLGMRETTILVVLAFLLLSVLRERRAISLISIALVFGIKLFLYNGHGAGPWHTMYVGLGAYDNPYGVILNDNAGYKLFDEKTVISNKTNAKITNYDNFERRERYDDTLKKEYLAILKESPMLLLVNAVKNTLGGYSFGYFVGSPLIQNMAIIFGGIFALLLLLFRQYVWFLAIGLSLISFTWFYPPIPAYMYGSYLIIIVSFIQVLSPLLRKIQTVPFIFRAMRRDV